MHSAVAFALDFAEAALEDALQAAHGLSQPSLAGAAAKRARAALARVEAASHTVEDAAACGDQQALDAAIDDLMALADEAARAADAAKRRGDQAAIARTSSLTRRSLSKTPSITALRPAKTPSGPPECRSVNGWSYSTPSSITPRAVNCSMNRICCGVRVRSERYSANAACAAARSIPTSVRTK